MDFGEKFFDIEIDPKESSVRQIRINKLGGMIYYVGSCGPLTGRGAELITLDYTIKNDREALSTKMRDNLWDWFKAKLFTRLGANGILILVMTRCHIDVMLVQLKILLM